MSYLWRKLTPSQRQSILAHRKQLHRPWHRPPHFGGATVHYHLSAACYNHAPYIGHSPERMAEFSENLLGVFNTPPAAWCVLPNHYHLLVLSSDLKQTVKALGRLHGRTSFEWNGEEGTRGRQIWHSASDRRIRSSRHFWATVNHIHHNPVRHGYVDAWQDWPYSSANDFLQEMGRENAMKLWTDHPIDDYGKGWDEPGTPYVVPPSGGF